MSPLHLRATASRACNRTWRAAAVILAAVTVSSAAAPAAQRTRDAERLLARDVTAGTIALLVAHAALPAVHARLDAALTDARPEVRAAAARVIFVVGAHQLFATVAGVLERESDPDAALEMARSLVHLAGPAHDQPVLAAWTRTSDDRLLMLLAAARGTAALDLLPRVRAMNPETRTLSSFLRRATSGDRTRLSDAGASALRQADAPLLAAVLTAAREERFDLAGTLLVEALDAATPRDMRTDTLWHLIGNSALEFRRVGADVLQAVSAFLDSVDPGPDEQRLFIGLEIASRALGRPPRSTPRWQGLLADASLDVRRLLRRPEVQAHLSAEERATVAGLPVPARARIPPRPREPLLPAGDDAFHAASDYPSRFLSSVLAETGCNLDQAQRQGLGGGIADLTIGTGGRVTHVALIDSAMPGQCRTAVRVLMMTYVRGVERGTYASHPPKVRLALPFVPDYVACLDETLAPGAVTPGGAEGIEPPKKIKDVRPVYPQSAQRDGVSGIVIVQAAVTAAGCVSDARIVGSVDSRLDWAALRAVVGWRYTPTRLDGVPVPIIMSVTVNFVLN